MTVSEELKNRTKNLMIWGGWYGSRNLGDRALLVSIIDAIVSTNKGPFNFIVPSAAPSLVNEYLFEINSENIETIDPKRNSFLFIKSLYSLDWMIFGGAVPFYDDFLHSFMILIFAVASKVFHFPILLWSVSSQKIKDPFTKFVIFQVVKQSKYLSVRDLPTKELLVGCGALAENVHLLPDPVIGMEDRHHNRSRSFEDLRANAQKGKKYFGLVPRTLRGSDGESHTHYSPMSPEKHQIEVDVFAEVVDHLVQRGYTPVLFPMNIDPPDDDRIAIRDILVNAKHGDWAETILESIFPKEVTDLWDLMDGAIVARIHGGITALRCGVPIIMYSFDQKHKGLMEALNMTDLSLDPSFMDAKYACAMIDRVIDENPDLKERSRKLLTDLLSTFGAPLKVMFP